MNSEPDRTDSDEGAFEAFINAKFGPETLAHIKKARPPVEAGFDRNGDLLKPRGLIINIDPSIYAAIRKYNEEIVAKLFYGSVPPVDTGTLRPSLTYEAFRDMYNAYKQGDAMRRQATEAEEYRIRQRVLATPGGEAFIARVDQFAASNGVEWVDAARICAFADMNEAISSVAADFVKTINSMFNSQAFEAFAKDAARMIEGFTMGIEDGSIQIPRNRHEKRASRHKKPLKDSDQEWKRRNSRNRRKR